MDKEFIKTILKRDIQTLGCDIWGVEFSGSTRNPTLRVYIDKDKGITIEDCEKVSRHISKVIEANEPSSNNFNLEVSSPGIERKFFNPDQYIKYLGFSIKVRYKDEKKGYKSIKGILDEVSKSGLVLCVKNQKISISFNAIEKANLDNKGE